MSALSDQIDKRVYEEVKRAIRANYREVAESERSPFCCGNCLHNPDETQNILQECKLHKFRMNCSLGICPDFFSGHGKTLDTPREKK